MTVASVRGDDGCRVDGLNPSNRGRPLRFNRP